MKNEKNIVIIIARTEQSLKGKIKNIYQNIYLTKV